MTAEDINKYTPTQSQAAELAKDPLWAAVMVDGQQVEIRYSGNDRDKVEAAAVKSKLPYIILDIAMAMRPESSIPEEEAAKLQTFLKRHVGLVGAVTCSLMLPRQMTTILTKELTKRHVATLSKEDQKNYETLQTVRKLAEHDYFVGLAFNDGKIEVLSRGEDLMDVVEALHEANVKGGPFHVVNVMASTPDHPSRDSVALALAKWLHGLFPNDFRTAKEEMTKLANLTGSSMCGEVITIRINAMNRLSNYLYAKDKEDHS